MKVLFSAKALPLKIQEAIDNNSTSFDIDGTKCLMVFHGDSDIHGFAQPTVNCAKDNYKGVFDAQQWAKIRDFVSQLPEQPIVLEVKQYTHTDIHDSPEITLSEFIMIF